MTVIIGTLSEFVLQKEKVAAYLEHMELFFASNGIEDEDKLQSFALPQGRNVCITLQPTSPCEAKFKDLYKTEGIPPATF